MPVSRAMAVFVGLLTLWPPVYTLVFLWRVLGSGNDPALLTGSDAFILMFRLQLVTMVLTIGLMAHFVVHVFNNGRLSAEGRVLWLAMLLLGNMFAFPLYWLLHVWRSPPPAAS